MQEAWKAALAAALLAAAAPAAWPDGAIEAGASLYGRCIGCHSPERDRTGPRHCGLIGRVSGTVEGYPYSDAMRDAAVVWNTETLDRFLAAPLDMIPGTAMGFAGMAEEGARRRLIAWLATLDDSSPLCEDDSGKAGGKDEP